MKIMELANLGANVSVCVSLADLKEFVSELIVESAAKPVEERTEQDGVERAYHKKQEQYDRENIHISIMLTRDGKQPLCRLIHIFYVQRSHAVI